MGTAALRCGERQKPLLLGRGGFGRTFTVTLSQLLVVPLRVGQSWWEHPGVLIPSPVFQVSAASWTVKNLYRPLFLLQVLPEEAKKHWESSYKFSLTNCNHAAW